MTPTPRTFTVVTKNAMNKKKSRSDEFIQNYFASFSRHLLPFGKLLCWTNSKDPLQMLQCNVSEKFFHPNFTWYAKSYNRSCSTVTIIGWTKITSNQNFMFLFLPLPLPSYFTYIAPIHISISSPPLPYFDIKLDRFSKFWTITNVDPLKICLSLHPKVFLFGEFLFPKQ